ncbi:MAG: hypothetical protein RDU25_06005 [Patescibacteria group bacterium]|nr:hypothetical protein [Patescibacteria group bacterium]
MLASVLVSACSASVQSGANTSGASNADWRRAYVSGEARCDKNQQGATAADYYACLEEQQRILNETKAAMPGSNKSPSTPPTSAPPQPVPQQPPMLPQPGVGPVPVAMPPQQTQGSVFIPGASGPVCTTNQELILTIQNNTNYLVEVRSPYVAPLGCDAVNTLVQRAVIRKGGQQVMVWVVPANTTARYVFLPLNGGLGRVRLIYNAFMDLPANVGAPQVGWMPDPVDGYQVPRHDGRGWTQALGAWQFRQ